MFFGVLSAVYQDSFIDHITRFVAITGYSLPSFVLGLVLLMVFYGRLHWFPPGRYTLETDMLVHAETFRHYTGLLTFDCLLNGEWAAYVDVVKHMVLPAATLLYISVALLLRITRSSMLEELSKGLRAHRARQGPAGERRHLQARARQRPDPRRDSLEPALHRPARRRRHHRDRLRFPGIGRWGVQAAQQLDIPGVLGSTLLAASLFVMAEPGLRPSVCGRRPPHPGGQLK